MKLRIAKKVVGFGFLSASFCLTVHAQEAPAAAGKSTDAPATSAAASSEVRSLERAFNDDGNWYFSWGYSRQQYAPSDIHISQPSQGNDFTVHKAAASDYPADFRETIDSIFKLDLTSPQENIRIGKFLNAEKTFAIEFNYDHSKYNTDSGQTAAVSGTINNQPAPSSMVLNKANFAYELHNGLNHLMINAVWFHHLDGPKRQPGELQLISRLGAGILLPHADNVILGNANQVGPKGVRVCCFGRSMVGPLAPKSVCATAFIKVCISRLPRNLLLGRYAVCRYTKGQPTSRFGCRSKFSPPVFFFRPGAECANRGGGSWDLPGSLQVRAQHALYIAGDDIDLQIEACTT